VGDEGYANDYTDCIPVSVSEGLEQREKGKGDVH
jgi:hypothetical protein